MSRGELPSYADVLEREAADEYAKSDGYHLVWQRAINPWQYKRADGGIELWGTVEEGNKKHQTYVLFNTQEREILEYSCDCDIHAAGDGMSAHCIALVVNYLSYVQLIYSPYVYTSPSSKAKRVKSSSAGTRKPLVRTSSEIKDLMRAYANQTYERTIRLAASAPESASEREVRASTSRPPTSSFTSILGGISPHRTRLRTARTV